MTGSHNDPLTRWRSIPLETVATKLGYRSDPSDRARYKRRGSVISINDGRFFDHIRAGGAGAIDLVIHATGWRFTEALRFLKTLEPPPEPDATGKATASLRLPKPLCSAWPGVRNALARQRALPPNILDACHKHGLLYADNRNNAVFICRNDKKTFTGAEILGTHPDKPFKGMATGSRKARGGFWIPCDRNPPKTVILTESAVDALSAYALNITETRKTGAVLVSTAGLANAIPTWIKPWKPRHIICAYDADPPGEGAAQLLARSDPNMSRAKPQNAKDWNELLQQAQQRS